MLLGAVVTAMIATLISFSSVNADLVEKDFNSVGDGMLTLETSTGLEWLDIPLTVGASYDQAEIDFSTFRHATKSEVLALLGEFGITPNVGNTALNFTPVQSMLDLTGHVLATGDTRFTRPFMIRVQRRPPNFHLFN